MRWNHLEFRVGPKYGGWCLHRRRRGNGEIYQEEGHVRIEGDVSYVVTSQEMSEAIRNWNKQRNIFP